MGVIVDYFAGGGGWSTGLDMAYGRKVDLAVNHSRKALAMHEANHPETEHACCDVFEFDIVKWLGNRRWSTWTVSPDCTHHSRAKGGKPVLSKRRSLADVVLDVLDRLPRWQFPDLIHLENVAEWLEWCRLDASGRPDRSRLGEFFRAWLARLEAFGYVVEWRVVVCADYGDPTTRKRLFLQARCDGLPITWPEPTHYNPNAKLPKDPDARRAERRRRAKLQPWRTAANDVIDFSIPGKSIFGRKKPLADATLRRVARGVERFVINNPKPFIVSVAHGDSGGRREYGIDEPIGTVHASGQSRAMVMPLVSSFYGDGEGGNTRANGVDAPVRTVTCDRRHALVDALAAPFIAGVTQSSTPRVFAADAPLPTITTAKGGELMVASPVLIQSGYGEREGQEPRALDHGKPLGTVVSDGNKFALASAHMLRLQGSARRDASIEAPLGAICAGGMHHAQVAAFMAQHNTGEPGHPMERPVSTIITKGCTQGLVEVDLSPDAIEAGCERVLAFMVKYYGAHERGVPVDAPLDSVTTKDRFALITVHIDGVPYRIFDIRIRMLTARELFNAQGFPRSYIIDPWVTAIPKPRKADVRAGRVRTLAKRMSKSDAIAMCGNSVPPGTAYAMAKAAAPPMSRLEGKSRWQERAAA
jgi:DNA (cytosine-5)-methyltransferase 1